MEPVDQCVKDPQWNSTGVLGRQGKRDKTKGGGAAADVRANEEGKTEVPGI